MNKVPKASIDLIKSFEGLYLKPYLDPIGIPTIGYGTIQYPDNKKVTMKDHPITESDAVKYLEHEVSKKANEIDGMLKVKVNENERAALICFAYNVGTGALQKSTLLKLLNSNADRVAIADQFLRWNKAGGKELPGLTRRRQAERSLFLQPISSSSKDEKLPSIPSDADIEAKLKAIEDDIFRP